MRTPLLAPYLVESSAVKQSLQPVSKNQWLILPTGPRVVLIKGLLADSPSLSLFRPLSTSYRQHPHNIPGMNRRAQLEALSKDHQKGLSESLTQPISVSSAKSYSIKSRLAIARSDE